MDFGAGDWASLVMPTLASCILFAFVAVASLVLCSKDRKGRGMHSTRTTHALGIHSHDVSRGDSGEEQPGSLNDDRGMESGAVNGRRSAIAVDSIGQSLHSSPNCPTIRTTGVLKRRGSKEKRRKERNESFRISRGINHGPVLRGGLDDSYLDKLHEDFARSHRIGIGKMMSEKKTRKEKKERKNRSGDRSPDSSVVEICRPSSSVEGAMTPPPAAPPPLVDDHSIVIPPPQPPPPRLTPAEHAALIEENDGRFSNDEDYEMNDYALRRRRLIEYRERRRRLALLGTCASYYDQSLSSSSSTDDGDMDDVMNHGDMDEILYRTRDLYYLDGITYRIYSTPAMVNCHSWPGFCSNRRVYPSPYELRTIMAHYQNHHSPTHSTFNADEFRFFCLYHRDPPTGSQQHENVHGKKNRLCRFLVLGIVSEVANENSLDPHREEPVMYGTNSVESEPLSLVQDSEMMHDEEGAIVTHSKRNDLAGSPLVSRTSSSVMMGAAGRSATTRGSETPPHSSASRTSPASLETSRQAQSSSVLPLDSSSNPPSMTSRGMEHVVEGRAIGDEDETKDEETVDCPVDPFNDSRVDQK